MKFRLSIIYLAFIKSILVGCTQDPTKVDSVEWSCDKKSKERECLVSFVAENQSHLPAASVIRIRAHLRKYDAKGAIHNNVVGDKVIRVTLAPGEKRQYSETLQPFSAITQIVVTISSKEQ